MRFRLVLLVVIATAPIAAKAQYRCVGNDGKTYYAQTIPPECAGATVTIVKPPPAAQRDPQHARDVAEREAELLRRLQTERHDRPAYETSGRGGVIGPLPARDLTPSTPRDDDAPSSVERDEPFRAPAPSGPMRRR